jgi:hypothetical protein
VNDAGGDRYRVEVFLLFLVEVFCFLGPDFFSFFGVLPLVSLLVLEALVLFFLSLVTGVSSIT